MGTLKKFEDIRAWQQSRNLAKTAYQISSDGDFNRDFGLRDRLRRAAVSIMANIAEGFSRDSNKEFYRFLSIAKSSAAEVKSHLYISCDIGYISGEQFDKLYQLSSDVEQMLSGLMKYLKENLA